MKHRIAETRSGCGEDASERGLVHYDGPSLVGWQTLCGHVDRVDFEWKDTNKRVNCQGCLDVLRHVTGRRPVKPEATRERDP